MVAKPRFFRAKRHGFFANRAITVMAEYHFFEKSHYLIGKPCTEIQSAVAFIPSLGEISDSIPLAVEFYYVKYAFADIGYSCSHVVFIDLYSECVAYDLYQFVDGGALTAAHVVNFPTLSISGQFHEATDCVINVKVIPDVFPITPDFDCLPSQRFVYQGSNDALSTRWVLPWTVGIRDTSHNKVCPMQFLVQGEIFFQCQFYKPV